MLDGGYVVSRVIENNEPWHQGDSLLFSGMALAVLPCADGDPIEDALLKMMDDTGGGLWRHPTQPERISWDGAVGAYRGIATRIVHCGSAEKWRPRLLAHLELNRLNPLSDVTWPTEAFRYVPELALARADGATDFDSHRLDDIAAQVETWAAAVQTARTLKTDGGECYRVNLAFQTLATVEELGGAFAGFRRDNLCAATRGMDLPHLDNWCGRGDLKGWIDNYVPNVWEYRFQRCPDSESPDGKDWLATPGVDLLEAMRAAYTLPR